MSYVMMLLESKFHVKKEYHDVALNAIKSLKAKENADSSKFPRFMWIQAEDVLKSNTLEEALHAWRWSIILNATGDIINIYEFTGEKYGEEDLLFKTIAPFVDTGSHIMMAGEDGVIWRWHFHGSSMQKQFGRVRFDAQAEKEVRTRNRLDSIKSWPHFISKDEDCLDEQNRDE